MERGSVKKRMDKRKVQAALCLLLLPASLVLGALRPEWFYGCSLLFLAGILGAFFLYFEASRPRAREMALLAVLSALAVAGRAAFFLLPQIKPMAAVAILSGAVFGPMAGVIVGSISCFVSNFLFGQGPYTLWQMTGMGLVGAGAGILFYSCRLPRKKWALCLYGAVSVLLLYGGLVNFSSVIFMGMRNWEGIIAIYAAGLPFDLLHGAGTVLFLLLLTKPMLEKLERVKVRYGILQESTF